MPTLRGAEKWTVFSVGGGRFSPVVRAPPEGHPGRLPDDCWGRRHWGPPPAMNITASPNPVIETGNSDVYAVISVAVAPVYAEQTVEIVSALNVRCGGGVTWITNQGTFTGSTATATIDDDGNATFTVLGTASRRWPGRC